YLFFIIHAQKKNWGFSPQFSIYRGLLCFCCLFFLPFGFPVVVLRWFFGFVQGLWSLSWVSERKCEIVI
ncbi:MAG: hypothetical protein IJH34_16070, partial [Romboutsia sp.]|nr:hypothetical protein [Romboutsia sp.]